jgi:glutamyl-Q tRNA(Asp) synthetase
MKTKQVITRFAPSPTGLLHKGHAFSAFTAYNFARKHDGLFILRIEDIDTTRCTTEFSDAICEDLRWLGITWEEPIRIQSGHFPFYKQELEKLKTMGLVYPCFCTRKDIREEIERSPKAPHGPEGAPYPGTCRHLTADKRAAKVGSGMDHAWRLDVAKAIEYLTSLDRMPLVWHDIDDNNYIADPLSLGDIVLARKDTPTSYHLSVTLDDAQQGISHVIRGNDLLHTTDVQVLLQALMGLPTPIYYHHKLLLDENGNRFAKRDKSVTLQSLRQNGIDPCSLLPK